MATYAKIVSFNDVKEASRLRYAQKGSEGGLLGGFDAGRSSRSAGFADFDYADYDDYSSDYYDLELYAGPDDDFDGYIPSGSVSKKTARSNGRASGKRPARGSGVVARLNSTRDSDEDGEMRPRDMRAVRSAQAVRAQRGGRADAELDYGWQRERYGEADELETEVASRRSSSERRKRGRAKAKAERMFAEQYPAERFGDTSADEGAGSPRAALYEGQMGATQRRAARMQRASEAGSSMAKVNPAGWFSNISVKPSRMRAVTAILCVVLAVAFLYTPAQHYYQATREHDKLVAEYASIQQRNQVITSQNTSLASNAGMEDAVRQKYGYVVAGEETALVSGLTGDESTQSGDGVEANVLSSTVKAPEEWYTPYLDALFGVS